MLKSVSPHLTWLSTVLNRRLAGILRTESNKKTALLKAEPVFRSFFRLTVEHSQRKLNLKVKLTAQEKTRLIDGQVADALKDFEKIYDDRSKPLQTP
jgi:hypothetical protein